MSWSIGSSIELLHECFLSVQKEWSCLAVCCKSIQRSRPDITSNPPHCCMYLNVNHSGVGTIPPNWCTAFGYGVYQLVLNVSNVLAEALHEVSQIFYTRVVTVHSEMAFSIVCLQDKVLSKITLRYSSCIPRMQNSSLDIPDYLPGPIEFSSHQSRWLLSKKLPNAT